MSTDTGTREAVGAEELGAGAGKVEKAGKALFVSDLSIVAQLPLASLSSLLPRVFDSHSAFFWLPDLTALGHSFFFNLPCFILAFCSQAVPETNR